MDRIQANVLIGAKIFVVFLWFSCLQELDWGALRATIGRERQANCDSWEETFLPEKMSNLDPSQCFI